jgi:nucleoside-diphosphate-sugar epimerase
VYIPAGFAHGIQPLRRAIDADLRGAALLHSDVDGAVNIASGKPHSVETLIEHIGTATGRPDLIDRGAKACQANDPPRLEAHVHRLRDEVGFVPRYSLAEGIADTVEWWRGQADPPQ